MSLTLSGIGVSRGICIGKVHIMDHGQIEVTEQAILPQHIETEVLRFSTALEIARKQLKQVRQRIPASTPADIAEFIDTHILMLEDSVISQVPIDLILSRQCNAEWALKLQLDTLVNIFDEMDDPYLRTRKDDVIHVVNRVLRTLASEEAHADVDGAALKGNIVVAEELAPADIILLHHQGISGIITEFGAPLSHTAIMARSLHIPTVVGIHHVQRYLCSNETVILDGQQGTVLADADEAMHRHYRSLLEQELQYQSSLNALIHEASVSRNGESVSLLANIELPADIEAVTQMRADGVGLFRTEFLFMNRLQLPDEEEQLASYTEVLNSLQGRPLTIRTLDLGADKHTSHSAADSLPANPALGLRAIRLCLKDPGLFMPQLRAILRASALGPVRIMIPMLSNIQELNQTLKKIEEAKQSLRADGLAYDNDILTGGMIEVPAAAVTARHFARQLDFLSIGTNDLIQYTLAIDRMDDEVNYLYDPLHPAVLQLIYNTIQAGIEAGIPVSMCGEMAGDYRYTRLLLAFGLREFSMLPASMMEVKEVVRQSHCAELRAQCARILQCADSSQILTLLNRLNEI